MTQKTQQTHKKRKSKTPNRFSLVNYFWLMFGLLVTFGPIVYFIKGLLIGIEKANNLLSNNTKVIKAIVINETNYVVNRNINKRDVYSYEFEVNGKIYKGSTESTDFKIGDSVNVKYYLANPEYHTIVK